MIINRQKFFNSLIYTVTTLLVVYLGYIVFGDNGFMHLRGMQAELGQLKSQNMFIEQENRDLHHTVNRLQNDPVYIEYVIRNQLQMNNPGELVFKFSNTRQPVTENTAAPQKTSP